jgi:hypothetical protein
MLFHYAELLRRVHRNAEARRLISRARQIESYAKREKRMQYAVSLEDI